MKIIEFIISFFAWLEIAVSPLIIGCVIGMIVYSEVPREKGIIIGITIVVLGLIIGIVWAIRIWKKRETVEFMSRLTANPELHNEDEAE